MAAAGRSGAGIAPLTGASRRSATTAPRVLLVEVNEDGTVGGSHRGLVDLALGLDRRAFEPVVLFYQHNRHVDALRAAGLEVVIWDEVRAFERGVRASGSRVARWTDAARAIGRRRRVLRELRIALLHMNNSLAVGYDDWLPAAKSLGIPSVTFAMGDAELPERRARWAAPFWDHVIAISDYMRRAVLDSGVAPDRVSLAYLGVDPAVLMAAATTPRAAIRRSLDVPDDEVLVVMVGNIRDWKGQHVLVEALSLVPEAVRSRLHVRFIGAATEADRAYVARVEATIERHGLAGQVRLVGPSSDVASVLAAADIAVHASTMAEPFGLVVPEAMALGIPVIASRFGGPGEVVTPGCGRLHDPAAPAELAAALTELGVSPGLRRELGDEARRRVGEFSVDAMVAGVRGVYTRLLV